MQPTQIFTPLEMASIYQQAGNKVNQIHIFSECNRMTTDAVIQTLEEQGVFVSSYIRKKLNLPAPEPVSNLDTPEAPPEAVSNSDTLEAPPEAVSNLDTPEPEPEPEPFCLTLTARETRELLLLANDYFEATLEWRDHAANQIATLMWFILETRRPRDGS